MRKTYLNGRISLTSLAAPTDEDLVVIAGLSEEDREALVREALDEGESSGLSDASMDDILTRALKRARSPKPSEHAL